MSTNLENRIAALEFAVGTHKPRSFVLRFVRPDGFVSGYLRTGTGEHISQSNDEPDEAFTARAAAAGFEK